jgi:hypothetical protein
MDQIIPLLLNGETAWHVRDLTIMGAKVVDRKPK